METITLILGTMLILAFQQQLESASTDSEKEMISQEMIVWLLLVSSRVLIMGARVSGNEMIYLFLSNLSLAVNMYITARFIRNYIM